MKKIISIILIACMCCSLFAACATSPKESSAPTPESTAPVEEAKESEKPKLDYPTRPITLLTWLVVQWPLCRRNILVFR